ncbi:MAG: protein phosphatase 2C domain-containing protein [Saccharofermentans sp.]|nr:protein phosphatase 2C domain-containing protein [Saccharofermentans sp.]
MANKIAAVTLTGQKHKNRDIPCEDSSLAISKNGVDVVVVADGAGSKQYTHAKYGSKAATEAIAELITEHFDAIYNENREAAIKTIVIAAVHVKFAALIEEFKLDSIERLSCTLLFVAVKDRRVIVGHLGDGLIVRVSSSGVSPLTMPQNDLAGHTYFVTANHAADYMRVVKTTTDDIHAIALMSDGVQDSVYDENSGLVKPVVARMVETLKNGREEAEKEISDIVEKYIVGGSNNSDDSSFGVLYIENTVAPNSQGLPGNADAFPRGTETFKDLQMLMVEDVKKAKKIILDAANNEAPSESKGNEDEDEVKSAEERVDTKVSEEPVNESAKDTDADTKAPDSKSESKPKNTLAMIMTAIAVIELIVIVVLAIK